jgi:hypothetical protein
MKLSTNLLFPGNKEDKFFIRQLTVKSFFSTSNEQTQQTTKQTLKYVSKLPEKINKRLTNMKEIHTKLEKELQQPEYINDKKKIKEFQNLNKIINCLSTLESAQKVCIVCVCVYVCALYVVCVYYFCFLIFFVLAFLALAINSRNLKNRNR